MNAVPVIVGREMSKEEKELCTRKDEIRRQAVHRRYRASYFIRSPFRLISSQSISNWSFANFAETS